MTLPARLLHGERIRLTALSDADVGTIARWSDDGEFLRLYDTRPARPRSEADIEEWLQGLQDGDRTITFGICLHQGDDLVGTLQLDGVVWAHKVCGIGLAIGSRENWSHGYGYKAAQLGLTFAFDELNLHRVTASAMESATTCCCMACFGTSGTRETRSDDRHVPQRRAAYVNLAERCGE
ncbi:MAG: GNAT family protein [Anaerolineae bacterium]